MTAARKGRVLRKSAIVHLVNKFRRRVFSAIFDPYVPIIARRRVDNLVLLRHIELRSQPLTIAENSNRAYLKIFKRVAASNNQQPSSEFPVQTKLKLRSVRANSVFCELEYSCQGNDGSV